MFRFPKKEISETSAISTNKKGNFKVFGDFEASESTETSENALVGAMKISKTLSKISEISVIPVFRNPHTAAFSNEF